MCLLGFASEVFIITGNDGLHGHATETIQMNFPFSNSESSTAQIKPVALEEKNLEALFTSRYLKVKVDTKLLISQSKFSGPENLH